MERRRYLQSITVGLGTLVAGCSGGEPGGAGSTGTADPPVTQGGLDARPTEGPTPTGEATSGAIPEAPVADSTTGWERRDYHEAGADADDPPCVASDTGNDRLYVRGVVTVGSSSCKEASVEAAEYEDGELYVYVLHDWKESVREVTPRECTADVSGDSYEVAVTFGEGLPARIVAEERDNDAEERRTVYER